MSNLKPRIYVVCLAAYNNGKLHGRWIDATQFAEEIWDEINDMLATSPEPDAEEWAIHDVSDFGDLKISENEDIGTVAELAKFIEEHEELGTELLSYLGNDLEDAKRYMEENYYGEYDSEEDFARHIAEETWEIPEHLESYIDYERIARELFMTDFISISINYKIHVFSCH